MTVEEELRFLRELIEEHEKDLRAMVEEVQGYKMRLRQAYEQSLRIRKLDERVPPELMRLIEILEGAIA